VTAERPGSQGLTTVPVVIGPAGAQSDASPLARISETVVTFGLPVFILCLPLEFTAQLFKLQLARIVLLVVGIAYAYLVMTRQRALIIPLSPSSVALALYAGASVISWLLTRAPGATNVAADVVVYPVMALLVVNLARTERAHRNAWTAFLVSGLAIALMVAFLYYAHLSIWKPDPAGVRVNATFGDPNVTARFLTLAACAAIVLFAAGKVPTQLALVTAAACSAFMTFTFSKSALLFLPISTLVAAAFGSNRRRAAAITAAALIALTAAVLLTPGSEARVVIVYQAIIGHAPDAGGSGISTPGAAQAAAGGHVDWVRVYLITAGLQMFKDHPVFGVGFGGYHNAILTTYNRFITSSPAVSDSHTSAITILSEQGLIGILLFGSFLVLLLREVIGSMRRRTEWRDWIVTPAVLLIPILMFSQLEGRLIEEPYLWLVLGLLYLARSLETSKRTVVLSW
jgi:O-antigen ligase